MKGKYLVKNGKEIGEKAIQFEKLIRQLLNENFELGIFDVDIAGLHLLFEQILYEVFSDKKVKPFQTEYQISDEHNKIDRDMRKIVLDVFGNDISDIDGACILMCFECLKWEYYDHLYRAKRMKDNPCLFFLPMAPPPTEEKKPNDQNGGYVT